MAGAIDSLHGLGPKSRAWLAEIDITDAETLRELGAVEVYCRLRFRFGNQISRNMLHALAAAIAGTDWRDLTADDKAALDAAVASRIADGPPDEN